MLKRFAFFGLTSALLIAPALSATVVIGKPNWPSAEVTAHIIAEVLTADLGHEAVVRPMGTSELLGAIDRGEVDVHPEIWLPNLGAAVNEYVNVQQTLRLSPKSGTASQHICTTRATSEALGLTSLADLSDPMMAQKFDTDGDGLGEMWIGDFTWSATKIERVRARSYGYNETMMLLTMPEDQAFAAVDAAVATDASIVFYCYAPHFLFRLHDVVRLDEPPHDPAAWTIVNAEDDPAWLSQSAAPTAWEPSRYQVGYAAMLAEDLPDVAGLLDNIEISSEDAEKMSYAVNVEGRDPQEIALEWVAANKSRIEEWTK